MEDQQRLEGASHQLQARAPAQLQGESQGLGTHRQEAWQLCEDRWLRLIPCSLPMWLMSTLRTTMLERPFYGSEWGSNSPLARRLLPALMLETLIKLATTITVARYYGSKEELGAAHFLAAFAGDSVGLARTAHADTPPSNGVAFLLHGTIGVAAGIPPAPGGKDVAGCMRRFCFPARLQPGLDRACEAV